MRRVLIAGVAVLIVCAVGVGARFAPQVVDGLRFQRALNEIGKAETNNGGPWPQPQETCFFCHGARGQSANAWYPALAGQPEAYLVAQLHAFATDRRPNPFMTDIARQLTDEQIKSMAAYFARQVPARNEVSASNDMVLEKRGLALVQARGCQACHGAALMGKEQVPRLAGQGSAYLAKQLMAFKSGERHDPSGAMNGLAATLSAEDVQAVSWYLAGLVPKAGTSDAQ
ncbi:c-type cytochrome [Burkholderia multivorans]|uniref:c-type cytochrome n=1 Tax=Burkholderia multivorans TaxID=87883 RepID=UPI0020A0E476|nr:c-type cytochrome [Burkholderia multivorans]MCO8626399.1 cytochrome c4 [Burkholderia multivorans]